MSSQGNTFTDDERDDIICTDGGSAQHSTTKSKSGDEQKYVTRKWITPQTLEERKYQQHLTDAAEDESTLIALPTGTGKTAVAARLVARRLEDYNGKVLMLAPTQPLVTQHAQFFQDVLDIPDHEIQVFTGEIPPDEREEKWDSGTSVILATPQVIENDLIGNSYSLNDVVHIIFDECHKAKGDYAYTYIAERYHGNATHPLVTALSASPGSTKDEILTVCENLGVTNVEVLTEEDEILQEYLYKTEITHQWVDLPDELVDARDQVRKVYKEKLVQLKEMDVLSSSKKDLSFYELQKSKRKIQRMIDNGNSKGYQAISIHAEAQKLRHGWQTIESQSPTAAVKYFERIIDESKSSNSSKAAERIAGEPRIKDALRKLREYGDVHPKYKEVRMQVVQTLVDGGQALIFTESRDTVSGLVEFLDGEKINPIRFVGQRNKEDDPGLTQTQQQEVLSKFRNGDKNVLVSTSVAEEGIDIPAVDLVLFFEPVPNAVRTVQRRGRTGRQTEGRVVVLIANGTGDVSAYWGSKKREKKMKKQLRTLKEMENELENELRQQQQSLSDFGERDTNDDTPVVYLDRRETKSKLAQKMDRMSAIKIKLDTLETADYVVSERVGIERKTLDDFVSSITDSKRDILTQVKEISDAYNRPVLLIEGGNGVEDLYGRSQVNEEAIRSMLQTIAIDFNVKVLFTHSISETAAQIRTLARREQEDSNTEINPHGVKDTETLSGSQEYVVSSVPDIGPVTAQKLLEEFGSPIDVFSASKEALQSVEGVGPSKAETITDILNSKYKSTGENKSSSPNKNRHNHSSGTTDGKDKSLEKATQDANSPSEGDDKENNGNDSISQDNTTKDDSQPHSKNSDEANSQNTNKKGEIGFDAYT